MFINQVIHFYLLFKNLLSQQMKILNLSFDPFDYFLFGSIMQILNEILKKYHSSLFLKFFLFSTLIQIFYLLRQYYLFFLL